MESGEDFQTRKSIENMNGDEFKKLSIESRFQLLKEEGTHLGSRFSGAFNIHLFSIYNFYAEFWQRISLPDPVWIEVVDLKNVINYYTEDLNPGEELGLHVSE